MRVMLVLFGYGGIEPATHTSIVRELLWTQRKWLGGGIDHHLLSDDALISRARSRATGFFLTDKADPDVLVMVDHDIAWEPVGALWRMAGHAVAQEACIAGLYAKRGFGRGYATRLSAEWTPGGQAFHEAIALATGFLAIPRTVLNRVIETCQGEHVAEGLRVRKCVEFGQGGDSVYWDVFRPFSSEDPKTPGKNTYWSEDWAWSMRCGHAGVKLLAWEKPVLRHVGKYEYTVIDGRQEGPEGVG